MMEGSKPILVLVWCILESADGAFYIFTRYIVGLTPFLGSNIEHTIFIYHTGGGEIKNYFMYKFYLEL